jgi:hypothetical protein
MKMQRLRYNMSVDIKQELRLMVREINKHNGDSLGGYFTYEVAYGFVDHLISIEHNVPLMEVNYSLLKFNEKPVLLVLGQRYTSTDTMPERSGNVDHIMVFYLMTNMAIFGCKFLSTRTVPLVVNINNPSKI